MVGARGVAGALALQHRHAYACMANASGLWAWRVLALAWRVLALAW